MVVGGVLDRSTYGVLDGSICGYGEVVGVLDGSICGYDGSMSMCPTASKSAQVEGDSAVVDLCVKARFGGLGLSLWNENCEVMLAQIKGMCTCVCVCVCVRVCVYVCVCVCVCA